MRNVMLNLFFLTPEPKRFTNTNLSGEPTRQGRDLSLKGLEENRELGAISAPSTVKSAC
jgi:hypothetical protein